MPWVFLYVAWIIGWYGVDMYSKIMFVRNLKRLREMELANSMGSRNNDVPDDVLAALRRIEARQDEINSRLKGV